MLLCSRIHFESFLCHPLTSQFSCVVFLHVVSKASASYARQARPSAFAFCDTLAIEAFWTKPSLEKDCGNRRRRQRPVVRQYFVVLKQTQVSTTTRRFSYVREARWVPSCPWPPTAHAWGGRSHEREKYILPLPENKCYSSSGFSRPAWSASTQWFSLRSSIQETRHTDIASSKQDQSGITPSHVSTL